MKKSVKVHFLGAAGTVTGSKYLLEFPAQTLLIDCGLFQGVKKLRELNWQQLPIKASDIDLVLLTHGHLDHTGFLPRLVNLGYRGPIWGTSPTMDVTEIILRDSARIQEEDAERANKKHFTQHTPALPLYDSRDVDRTIPMFQSQPLNEWIDITDEIRIRFRYNGHILGATWIELNAMGKYFLFSGDIGRKEDALLKTPDRPEFADILFMESTYGDRLHPEENTTQKLEKIIIETTEKKGTLIIPSFAVERAQLLMYHLWQLDRQHRLPKNIPVYLDTPMGADTLKLFQKHPDWHTMTQEECRDMCLRIQKVRSYSETWKIIDDPSPKIIIAGSGMVTGGRVLTYLQQYIERPETTVLLSGFQAEGTRGRQLLDGIRSIKFYGKYFMVNARIDILEGLSGHADQNELLDWVSDIKVKPESIYLTHGEPQASDQLRVKLKDLYDWKAHIPELYEIHEITLDSQ